MVAIIIIMMMMLMMIIIINIIVNIINFQFSSLSASLSPYYDTLPLLSSSLHITII